MSETSTSAINGTDAALRERVRLTFDLDVDICVVGAGLAGLTVALEAARLGASVAVLEGRHVGWNASGNNLGTVIPGDYTIVAIENGWDLNWSQPGVIAHYVEHGKKITVPAGAQEPVHLSEPVEVQPR